MADATAEHLAGVRILHVVYGEILEPIVESQVVEPLALLLEKGLRVELVAFVTPKVLYSRQQHRRHQERLQKLRRRLPGTPIRFMVHTPRNTAAYISSRRLLKAYAPRLERMQPTIIHSRGLFATSVARRLHNALPYSALLYDQRGHVPMEMGATSRRDGTTKIRLRRARNFEKAERKALQAASFVLTTSEFLKSFDIEKHGADPDLIRVEPAMVDVGRFRPGAADRAEVRQELGIPTDARVLVHAGSSQPWQCHTQLGELAARAMAADEHTHFLILSPHDHTFRRACVMAGVPEERLHSRAVDFGLMPRYLCAADAGVILREPSDISRAASPVKLVEMLACGLPVLVSPEIGLLSNQIAEADAGVIVPELSKDAYDAALGQLPRLLEDEGLPDRASILAGKNYSLTRAMDRLVADYGRLTVEFLSKSPEQMEAEAAGRSEVEDDELPPGD